VKSLVKTFGGTVASLCLKKNHKRVSTICVNVLIKCPQPILLGSLISVINFNGLSLILKPLISG
jgi:hypothetical protein